MQVLRTMAELVARFEGAEGQKAGARALECLF